MSKKNLDISTGNKPNGKKSRVAEQAPNRPSSMGPLTDREIRNAPVWKTDYKMSEPGGLYLLVKPNGSKWWRMRYSIRGVQKQISMGVYPQVTLARARAACNEAKALIARGIDPLEARREEKSEKKAETAPEKMTFGMMAEEWFKKNEETWANGHKRTIRLRLDKYVLPFIANANIAELKTVDYARLIAQIENRNLIETAKRVGQLCGQITRYARAIGILEYDTAGGISQTIKRVKETHFAAITDPLEFGRLLLALDAYHGAPSTQYAIRIMPYVFVRSGELRGARWDEIDFEKEQWTIPAERMKMKRPHIVPLAPQTLALFREAQAFSGDCELVFPGHIQKNKCLTDVGLLNALRRIGYERDKMTIHGFRSTASTMLNEMGYNRDWIEMQLAHAEKNAVRDAYNRAQWLPERKKMMREWADYIDGLKAKARS